KEIEQKIAVQDIRFIPISALNGDNVVEHGTNMGWYKGGTLLHTLETLPVSNYQNNIDVRFPVQTIIRPHKSDYHDFRGYAGRLAGGNIRKGEELIALPSGLKSTVKAIYELDKEVDVAIAGQSITIELDEDLDISRGDLLARPDNSPNTTQDLDAMICWMGDQPLVMGKKYLVRHCGKEVKAVVKELVYKIDFETYQRVNELDT